MIKITTRHPKAEEPFEVPTLDRLYFHGEKVELPFIATWFATEDRYKVEIELVNRKDKAFLHLSISTADGKYRVALQHETYATLANHTVLESTIVHDDMPHYAVKKLEDNTNPPIFLEAYEAAFRNAMKHPLMETGFGRMLRHYMEDAEVTHRPDETN
jgi:hypothetical protein